MNRYGRANAVVAGTIGLVLLLALAPAWAVRAPERSQAGAPDVDVRQARSAQEAAAPGPKTAAQREALQRLEASVRGLTVRWSLLTGVPRHIFSLEQPLTEAGPASNPRAVAMQFLNANLPLLNLAPGDISQLRTSRDFKTRHNGVTHLTFQQQAKGIDIFGARIKVNIDSQGRVLNLSGEPIPGVHGKAGRNTPALSAEEAILRAADSAGLHNLRETSRSERMVYFPVSLDEMRLAFEVFVEDADTPNIYRTLVDAEDGTVLWRQNTTNYAHIDAHGLVYTDESPDPNSPVGTSTGIVLRDDVPFSGIGFFPHDDPHFDWWNGAARTTTVSNNVFAQEDRDGDDAGGFRPTAGAGEDFSFNVDLTLDPSTEDATTQNQSSAIVNLFYWNNLVHDMFYRLGFDEEAENFQEDNFGLGGSDGDPVRADAQDNRDGATPSLCNANFGFPGGQPTMQMFQCDKTTPERDGDFDNPVIVHEYVHGVHSRLILTSGAQRPNEGWGDFFALSMTAVPEDDLEGTYEVGEWLFGFGIRREPYSTDQSVYTLTYGDLTANAACEKLICSDDSMQICTDDDGCGGATDTCDKTGCDFHFECQMPETDVDQGICVPEVHNTGELWAEALWLVRANLVRKYGFTTGNRTMNQLVIDGMKLSPDDPTFVDGRDAILEADLANEAGVNQCLIWDGFAKMGVGVSALTTDATDINPVEAFDTPPGCTPNIQVNAPGDLGDVCEGEFSTRHLEVFNTGTGDLVVNDVFRLAGSDSITVDPLPEVPVVISPGAHVDFTVRCEVDAAGTANATIRVESNDLDEPVIDLEYICRRPTPDITTIVANDGSFGDVCRDTFHDLDLVISNTGGCNLSVSDISSSEPGIFKTASVMSPPLIVGAGDSISIPIRFEPMTATPFGPKSAIITITHDAPGGPKDVSVSGNVPPGDIEVTGSTDFGDVCAGDLAERTVAVCNLGLCNLELQNAEIVNCLDGDGMDDFTIINPPDYPAPISHDFCLDLVVRFTPSSMGFKQCTLRITSDDPDEGVVDKILTGTTPVPMIDVPPDQSFPPTVIQSVATCSSSNPFPVSNIGQCNLTITDLSVTSNDAEYSLSGLPSFPILLEPGHIAGEGDLETVFGPEILERIRTGEVTVTYVSEPILGLTTEVPRNLCGEGVRTGARVLVVSGGVPLPEVKSIKLQRLQGNRNRNRLDTVDQARNLPLLTEVPAAPCASIQYHREYGTVTNPIQLAPGAYQVTVMARIAGKNKKKVVGFDVDSCGFNATIVVDF